MRKAKFLLLAALWLIILALMFGLSAPHVRATDYGTYDNLVLSTFSSHVIALWPLNETAGTAANDISGNGHNGTYTGVTLDYADGAGPSFGRAGYWDGSNDNVNVYSVGLAGAFPKNVHTISLWFQVPSAATWTDSAYRVAASFNVGGSMVPGLSEILKYNSNDSMVASIYGNSVGGNLTQSTSSTTWNNWILISDNTVGYAYFNGSQVGTSVTRGSWTDALFASGADIGSRNHGNYWFKGLISQVVLLDIAADSAGRAILADANPITATATPTATATSLTSTPRPPQLISTLQNGNQVEVDFSITAGDIALILLGMIVIGLLVFRILLKPVKR